MLSFLRQRKFNTRKVIFQHRIECLELFKATKRTMPPKRKCTFNSDLQKEYPFLKRGYVDSEVRYNKCTSTFSVAHGGKSDIAAHLRSDKHRRADSAAAATTSARHFFRNVTMGDTEQKLAAAEGTWAYHTVQHNQSFRSTDCTSKLVQKCF